MATTDYGVDLGGATDLDPGFALVTGRNVVAHRIARRLQTPRGGLFYAPDFGIDVRDLIEAGIDGRGLARWQTAIARECEKDEAVDGASCSIVLNAATQTATVTVELTMADGPFDLVLSVSSLTVAIMEGA